MGILVHECQILNLFVFLMFAAQYLVKPRSLLVIRLHSISDIVLLIFSVYFYRSLSSQQCLRLLDCAIETCLLSSALLLVKWYVIVILEVLSICVWSQLQLVSYSMALHVYDMVFMATKAVLICHQNLGMLPWRSYTIRQNSEASCLGND